MNIETTIWKKENEQELRLKRFIQVGSFPEDLGITKMLAYDIYRPTGNYDTEKEAYEYTYIRRIIQPDTVYYDVVVTQKRMDDIIDGIISQSILPGVPDIIENAKIGDYLRITDGSKEIVKQIRSMFPLILKKESLLMPEKGENFEYSWEDPKVVNLGLQSGFQNGLQLREALSFISEDGCVVVLRW